MFCNNFFHKNCIFVDNEVYCLIDTSFTNALFCRLGVMNIFVVSGLHFMFRSLTIQSRACAVVHIKFHYIGATS